LFDGQYASGDTGLIYLRARTYDPGSAQFTTEDPISPVTRAPYGYVADNPLTYTDPAGLCSINPFSSSNCLSEGAGAVGGAIVAGGEWAYDHPAEAGGLALGAVSLATGVGAVADVAAFEAIGGSTTLGALSAATGAAGAGLDGSACLGGGADDQTVACVGFALNGVGASLGAGATLIEAGLLESSPALEELVEYGGLSAAGLGFGTDVYGVLEAGLGCELLA
jgi:RHS repeat-associated protein